MRYRNDPALIRGSIAALITPFTSDGDLDTESLRRLVQWQQAAGSHGISIGGSTGEPGSQTAGERIVAIQTVAETVADGMPFLAGTGSAKLEETLQITSAAQDAGADAALIITPYYARPTQPALYEWYATVAREFPDLPIVIYNVPSRTAVDIHPETVARLHHDFENIVGIKETTKDFEHFSRVIQTAGSDLLVWSGIELLCLPLLAIGGIGFVSATANIAPRSVAQMYNHWADGDFDSARELHYALHPLVDLLFVETNPTTAKWVLEREGRIASAHVRPPLVRTTVSGVRAVEALLDEAQDLMKLEGEIR